MLYILGGIAHFMFRQISIIKSKESFIKEECLNNMCAYSASIKKTFKWCILTL